MTDPATPNAWQPATIERATAETPHIKTFLLRPETWRPFVAGQHLDVRLTAPDGYQAQRSYSLTSPPEQTGVYELAIDLLPDGEGFPFFHEIAAQGDSIEIRGPFGGHFVWQAADGGPLLLVGGGSGIAPLISMLRHRAAAAPEVPAVLIAAARTWEDLPFRDELLERDRTEPGLHVILAQSRDRPRRPQDVGRRLDAPLLRAALALLGSPPRLSFICGSNAFAGAAATHAVELGLPPQAVRTERYGGD